MLEVGKKAAVNKKAYEIAYALFRVAANMDEQGIAETLKSEALCVLRAVAAQNYKETEKSFDVLDYFLKLAMDLNAIGFANGEILTKELGNVKLAIAECVRNQEEAVDISDFFSKSVSEAPRTVSSNNFFREEGIAVSRAEEYQVGVRHEDDLPLEVFSEADPAPDFSSTIADSQSEHEQSGNNPAGVFLKSGMRQIAILDKIRQSGNCRLRDLHEVLPDSSERTIRYDLESLLERRLIERSGNGGPSVSYRMRQI